MPPYRANRHFHLSRLPVATRAGLTIFCLTILGGLIFTAVSVFGELTGYTTKGVQINYIGSEAYAEETGKIPETFHAAKSRREVNEMIIHPHSFLMPVIFFLLCHLMDMCFAPSWLRMTLYVGSGLGMIAVIYAPAMILADMTMAAIMVPAASAMLLGFTIMTLIPTWQMWRGCEPRPRSALPEGPGEAPVEENCRHTQWNG